MSELSDGAEGAAPDASTEDDSNAGGAYEPPRIVWREPYEPLSFGVSCAKQPGNPSCNPGPYSS